MFPIDHFHFLFLKKRSPALTVPPLSYQTSCTCTKSNLYSANSLVTVVTLTYSYIYMFIGLYFGLWICVFGSSDSALKYAFMLYELGAQDRAVSWRPLLQAGRSQIWFSIVTLEFFINIIVPAALWPWGWLSL